MTEHEHSINCLKCGKPIRLPATGRPPAYCSVGCRRSAEKECTRLNDRLSTLEKMAMNCRLAYGLATAGELRGIEAEITRADERLRDLLENRPE